MLALSFDQDKGIFTEKKRYKLPANTAWIQVTASGEFLYYITNEKLSSRKNISTLNRISINDLENGIYDNILKINVGDIINAMTIGIDGNIYIKNTEKLYAVYDSESDNPQLELLYDGNNIADFCVRFPNYLYPFELFAAETDCNKNVDFTFQDKKNEIKAYEWNFGDGNTSEEKSPKHLYQEAGVYKVSLKVTLNNGYKKTIPSRKIAISKGPKAPSIKESK